MFDEPDQPHAYRASNLLVGHLDSTALATLPKVIGPSTPAMCIVNIRHLRGSLARPPHVANAVGHRDAAYSLSIVSPMETGAEETVQAAHRAAVEPWSAYALGRSLNFSYGPLDERQVRAAFTPQDYRRLTELKARYDPASLLHCNHPIPLATPD